MKNKKLTSKLIIILSALLFSYNDSFSMEQEKQDRVHQMVLSRVEDLDPRDIDYIYGLLIEQMEIKNPEEKLIFLDKIHTTVILMCMINKNLKLFSELKRLGIKPVLTKRITDRENPVQFFPMLEMAGLNFRVVCLNPHQDVDYRNLEIEFFDENSGKPVDGPMESEK